VDLNVFNNRITALPAEVMALEELRVRASQPCPSARAPAHTVHRAIRHAAQAPACARPSRRAAV
jgi:hypothetical protein